MKQHLQGIVLPALTLMVMVSVVGLQFSVHNAEEKRAREQDSWQVQA